MKKYTYEEVKSYFDKSNLTLLSKEYVNCKEPLRYICNCHFDKGIQSTTFDCVKNRHIYTCRYSASVPRSVSHHRHRAHNGYP